MAKTKPPTIAEIKVELLTPVDSVGVTVICKYSESVTQDPDGQRSRFVISEAETNTKNLDSISW